MTEFEFIPKEFEKKGNYEDTSALFEIAYQLKRMADILDYKWK